jgi:prolyl-tRNA synthetase
VGVPTIVVVGRGLASGVIEVKDRKTGERTEVALTSAVEHLSMSCRATPQRSKALVHR